MNGCVETAVMILSDLLETVEAEDLLSKSIIDMDPYELMMAPTWIAAMQFVEDHKDLLEEDH